MILKLLVHVVFIYGRDLIIRSVSWAASLYQTLWYMAAYHPCTMFFPCILHIDV
jgi:hypothetical protein